jgi:hypothetical protein
MAPPPDAVVTHSSPWAAIGCVAVILTLAYAASCALFPFKSCPWCQSGKIKRGDAKVWRKCGHCEGSGQRLRWGRALYDRTRSGRRRSGS